MRMVITMIACWLLVYAGGTKGLWSFFFFIISYAWILWQVKGLVELMKRDRIVNITLRHRKDGEG